MLHFQLLANEIRREQNTLLQCVRHTVRSQFFGAGDTGKSLAVGSMGQREEEEEGERGGEEEGEGVVEETAKGSSREEEGEGVSLGEEGEGDLKGLENVASKLDTQTLHSTAEHSPLTS